jgi:cytoskeletal protein CcmA (bactofilin family)
LLVASIGPGSHNSTTPASLFRCRRFMRHQGGFMFTRNSQDNKPAANEPRPFDALKLAATNGAAEARSMPPPVASGASSQARSIIGNDLTIVGQGLRIISQGILQVDGDVTGDVVGSEVIIGEKGRVTGVVSGESVIVRGEVAGTIRGLRVVLQAGAKVEGDVHHQVLSVEQGAFLDGRVRRPQDANELRPILDPAAHSMQSGSNS